MSELKPARMTRATIATGETEGLTRIVADFDGDETQIAIIRPPTELYPDDDGAAVCAWAERHVRLWMEAPELLAAAERIQQSLDDHAPGGWRQKDRQMLARAIAKVKGANDG